MGVILMKLLIDFEKILILSLFWTAMMIIGMIGAFVFILIQLILLVDFAHAWNEKWLGNYEESQSKAWFAGEELNFPAVKF